SQDSSEVEKRRRPSRGVPKPVKYIDSMEDSDGEEKPATKKSRSGKKMGKKDRSSNVESQSDTASKKHGVSKMNETELECPECEVTIRQIDLCRTVIYIKSFFYFQAGLALLCECGNESFSEKHSYVTTPQCVLCEIYPSTA
ncbi:hypothetical protein PENTCL1PPCAC_19359, partial [Pristionchus entomophagus]